MIPPVGYYSYVGQGIQSSHQKMYFWTKDTFEQNYKGLVLYSFWSSTHFHPELSQKFPIYTVAVLKSQAYSYLVIYIAICSNLR